MNRTAYDIFIVLTLVILWVGVVWGVVRHGPETPALLALIGMIVITILGLVKG